MWQVSPAVSPNDSISCYICPCVIPSPEYRLDLSTDYSKSDKMWLPWLGYQDYDFHPAGTLCSLPGSLALMKQTTMLERPMWQGTEGGFQPINRETEAFRPTTQEEINLAKNKTQKKHMSLEADLSSLSLIMTIAPDNILITAL